MYQFLDLFFIVFHSVLILFNLFGWLWQPTRLLNFITLSLTAFSWVILGIWYGFGYCPCTHWHWLVRRELGYYDMPNSYIKFLVDLLTGWDVSPVLVDWSTGILFLVAFCCSAYTNYRDWKT
ncbi:MAG: DUF2784 domain-containing protein [Balneolaceae bacterium]|nr:DUF2784 domain-containing protein [Balneolaceae bacterium]